MSFCFNNAPMSEIERQVLEAMRKDGISPSEDLNLKADGKVRRFNVEGHKYKNNKNGVYLIFEDGWGGWYMDHSQHDKPIYWKFNREAIKDTYPDLYIQSSTKEFQAALKQREEAAEKEFDAERVNSIAESKVEFDAASFVVEDKHSYLTKKHVQSYGLKQNQRGNLLIPLHDIDGKFKGLQRIYEVDEGRYEKRFSSLAVSKGSFYILGNIRDGATVILSEGYATGATVYSRLYKEYPVVICFTCGNLGNVAQALRGKYRGLKIFIAADNDAKTKGNPGLTAAKNCCDTGDADGYFAPPFSEEDKQDGLTDWNDFDAKYYPDHDHATEALADALKQAIEEYEDKRWSAPIQDLIANFKPTEYLIGGWLPEQSQAELFGASGSYKSTLTVDFACSIACNEISDWDGQPVNHGGVFYMCGEGLNGLIARIIAWQQDKADNGINIDISKMNLHVAKSAKVIDSDKAAQSIIDEIERANIKDLKLIVVDTLSRYFGGDENNAGDAMNFLNQLAKVQRKYKCACLIVHHSGVSEEAKNRGRGSSAFRGAVDVELKISVEGQGENRRVKLLQTKNKDDALQAEKELGIKEVMLNCFTEQGRQISSIVLTKQVAAKADKTPNEKLKLKDIEKLALENYIEAALAAAVFKDDEFYGVRLKTWKDTAYQHSSANNTDAKRKAFNRQKKALVETLKILISDDAGNDNKNGDIYRPTGGFKEYAEAAGLLNKYEQISINSRSEII